MNPSDTASPVHDSAAIDYTRRWLERAVIGLNLCPFAKAVHVRGQIHWACARGDDEAELMACLSQEATELVQTDPAARDTTLLVLPDVAWDFGRFHAFTRRAEKRLAREGHEGVLQLASFHPQFEFGDAGPDDITHATNRSPYPMLHLLREDSVARAVAAYPDASGIYDRNIERLRELGHAGWQALGVGGGEAGR